MNNTWVVFNNRDVYLVVKNSNLIPSLGEPSYDEQTPRCVSCYTYTEEDIANFNSFDGVECMDHIPEDWTYPEC